MPSTTAPVPAIAVQTTLETDTRQAAWTSARAGATGTGVLGNEGRGGIGAPLPTRLPGAPRFHDLVAVLVPVCPETGLVSVPGRSRIDGGQVRRDRGSDQLEAD